MNYLNTYFSRVNHLGETTAERIRNGGIRSFEKWLAESPHTLRNLSVERGLYFSGIILSNKDKEYQKIMFLNVANDIPIQIGDIMNWPLEDGTIEKWLLIQEEKKVNGTYRTFWIVRCNYLMKWIDKEGHLQQSWSYFVSSLSDKIKGNFRTWHSLITPQPNKYAELLMPKYPIERATNFIVEEESWSLIEYDHTSVPGIMYLSLTENKINSIYDDVENNIADLDKLARYELLVADETQSFNINEPIVPTFTLTKNGIPYNAEINLLPTNKQYARIINNQLTAIKEGTTDIIIQLKDFPEIKKTLTININNGQAPFVAYLEGADTIKLDRQSMYSLKGNQNIDGEVIFTLDTSLAKIVSHNNNECLIQANNKNKLGEFTLFANYNDQQYSKVIRIMPLW